MVTFNMPRQLVPVLVVCGVLALPVAAPAQYFGQNKVRYAEFDFKVLRTAHFDIYYYERERRAIEAAAQLAERWYTRLSAALDYELGARQPLILYASHADFEQTTVIPGLIGESTGGVTEALRNRVVLPFTASLAETSHVLGHELVHAFQFDMSRGTALRLPLWFVEGMAEFLSLGPVHAHTAVWLRDAAAHEALPSLEELDDPRFFPYRFGHAAWAYFSGRWGSDIVPALFMTAAKMGDPLSAVQQLTGLPVAEISEQWHTAIVDEFAVLADAQAAPAGRPLITVRGDGGELNVGPALSPDGERLVFLSERDLFSIEMFLANARTGEIIRKITDLATDPHLDSIQFLESTGAWDHDGRRFAYSSRRAGDPVLIILDADSGETVREIELPSLGEVINPTFSPDGRAIAFSGLSGGVSDLFIFSLADGRLQQVTNDLFAQIQPDWSPDGRSIVMVTDRFTTSLSALSFGKYGLAVYDVKRGAVREVPAFSDAKHITPQWSPDGRALYFISDPNGVPNVFRLDLGTGAEPVPLTNVLTGVTGITGTSPALDVASRSGRLAFTLFADGQYEIHTIDAANLTPAALVQTNAAVLPPAVRDSRVARLLHAPAPSVLADARKFTVEEYDPELGLEYVGAAASTGFGVGTTGTALGGGVAVAVGDILNFHQVSGVIDANVRSVRDIGGQLTYLNRQTRWNIGGAVRWLPYAAGVFNQRLAEVDGRRVIVEREEIFRQTNRQLLGLAEYPFNRATRVEFSAGVRSIAFDREVTTRTYDATTGRLFQEHAMDLGAPATLNLAQSTAAFVYDTSVFGGTSPVMGSRTRLEATPTFGGLNFTEVLADVRRYFVPARPLTLAARALHLGRYGPDSQDGRLTPLFIGYPGLVRGYELGSYTAGECLANATSDCPAFDRLVGTRLFVANGELRFPLVGLFQGEFNYGPLPLEGFVFGDAGVAWTGDDEPTFLAGERELVASAGAGVRVNAFGYLVLEFAAARPFDRPDDRWRFIFNILPGF